MIIYNDVRRVRQLFAKNRRLALFLAPLLEHAIPYYRFSVYRVHKYMYYTLESQVPLNLINKFVYLSTYLSLSGI